MGSTPWAKSPSIKCVKFSIILGAVQTPFDSKPKCFAIKVPSFIAKAGFLDRMISTVSTLAVTAFSHDFGPIRQIFRLCLLPWDAVDQLEQSPKWTAV